MRRSVTTLVALVILAASAGDLRCVSAASAVRRGSPRKLWTAETVYVAYVSAREIKLDELRRRFWGGCIGGVICGMPAGLFAAGMATSMDLQGSPAGAVIGAVMGASFWVGAQLGTPLAFGRIRAAQYSLPDIGELALDRFLERVAADTQAWPPLVRTRSAFCGTLQEHRLALELRFDGLKLSDYDGLSCDPTARLIDGWMLSGLLKGSETLWVHTFKYDSRSARRRKTLAEYKADDFRLLKDEMSLVADSAVAVFLADLRRPRP